MLEGKRSVAIPGRAAGAGEPDCGGTDRDPHKRSGPGERNRGGQGARETSRRFHYTSLNIIKQEPSQVQVTSQILGQTQLVT